MGLSFALYIGVAVASRVRSTSGFYVAGQGVPAVLNGMATGSDWMSAASFISMAGIISFMGYSGSVYLIGWTGGYVLLALLLAPYLRRFGKFTVPDFIGDRYYSNAARTTAVVCAIFISFTYVSGQMRGVGVVFSRFLEVDIDTGVIIGMALVFVYGILGGMKGITYTQVAQYLVLIVAYLIPAAAISLQITGNPVPQLGLGGRMAEGENAGVFLLEAIDQIHRDLGFPEYTRASLGMVDMVAITLALMAGTAGLPHVIIRFYTVKGIGAARWSAFWALVFIGLLYTTAPAVAAFARASLIETLHGRPYQERPEWFRNWESTGLIAWLDKNGDGLIQYGPGRPFVEDKPVYLPHPGDGEQSVRLANAPSANANELYVDRDIVVLASPEIARLPAWVVALVAAGGLAAALSTAAGLLLVISASLSHDLGKRIFFPRMSERTELLCARIAAALAVGVAGILGIHPPGFVAEVVAFAFGLAASSFFPAIVLGIFSKRTTREGMLSGMIAGIVFTGGYIVCFEYLTDQDPWLGVDTKGIGAVGMLINFGVSILVSALTREPPPEVQRQVEQLRLPDEE